MTRIVVFRIALFLAIACGAASLVACSGWHRYEVCFGMSGDGGRVVVAQQDWADFVESEIAPRFPDGFTILNATGHWRDESGRAYSEPSKVLLILAPDSPAPRSRLDAIMDVYKKRFRQECVLEARSPARVAFR